MQPPGKQTFERPGASSDQSGGELAAFFGNLGWPRLEIRTLDAYPRESASLTVSIVANEILAVRPESGELAYPSQDSTVRIANVELRTPCDNLIESAQRLAADSGCAFAFISIGSDAVVFRSYIEGTPWRHGTALCLRGVSSADPRITRILSRQAVHVGTLLSEFTVRTRSQSQRYTPILCSSLDPGTTLIRNDFWDQLKSVFEPLFMWAFEDSKRADDIIQNCYVTTKSLRRQDDDFHRLILESRAGPLRDAGFVPVNLRGSRRSALDFAIKGDLINSRPGTHIITGGVGCGKTSYIKHFAATTGRALISERCIWLYLDFVKSGIVDGEQVAEHAREFIGEEAYDQLRLNYSEILPDTESLFEEWLQGEALAVRRALARGYSPGGTLHGQDRLTETLSENRQIYLQAAFRWFRERLSKTVVIVFDNTDQAGERLQEAVYLYAQYLCDRFKSLCIVALREEKFFAAYRRGIFDAYGDRRFHVGSPDLDEVIRKRLHHGLRLLERQRTELGLEAREFEKLQLFIKVLIESVHRSSEIVRMLSSVSNGDVRHSLDLFRHFMRSGNTDVNKIVGIANREGSYRIPFHEFLKSVALQDHQYFRAANSPLVNVFAPSGAAESSTFTQLRILRRLSEAINAPSRHGVGYVRTATLRHEYIEAFESSEDFDAAMDTLLAAGLVESEPPKTTGGLFGTVALRVSASGAYYWRFLVRSFAYLDLVIVDTPIGSHDVARKLAGLADRTDLTSRFERVDLFLETLLSQEQEEVESLRHRHSPYRYDLMPSIIRHCKAAMENIRARLHLSE